MTLSLWQLRTAEFTTIFNPGQKYKFFIYLNSVSNTCILCIINVFPLVQMSSLWYHNSVIFNKQNHSQVLVCHSQILSVYFKMYDVNTNTKISPHRQTTQPRSVYDRCLSLTVAG